MSKFILMAEESERVLLDKMRDQLGFEPSDAQLVYTGVGAINVLRSLGGLDRDSEVYNVGYAGSANFDLGTWVEVTEVRLNHPNVKYAEPSLPLEPALRECAGVKRAVCYTNCDFVLASDYKDCVFDMELAFIASLGFKHVHSLKYVSDNLSLHTYREQANGVEENDRNPA